MKKYLLLICLAWLPIDIKCASDEPLLTIVLMVKNEAPVICETLRPYVDAGIDHYLIFDTGSIDDTIAVVRKFFDDHEIKHAVIKQESFIDFSSSRNRALELAQETFPEVPFMLMPDAEWFMHNVEGLLDFCALHKNNPISSYLVRILNSESDFYTSRLIRSYSHVKFVGVVHECLNQVSVVRAPADVFFEWRPSRYGADKTRDRWFRDSSLLLKEYYRNPQDPRTVFYLAQTFACLGEWEMARIWYERRIAMPGWDEENYMAHYKLANVYESLDKWDLACQFYLKAFSMRPHRAEPLIKLAQHYWQTRECALCYLYSLRAVAIPYPDKDLLVVEKEMYEYQRYDLLGISAWHVGEYEVGLFAVRKAMEKYPEMIHLKNNLHWYLQKQSELAS